MYEVPVIKRNSDEISILKINSPYETNTRKKLNVPNFKFNSRIVQGHGLGEECGTNRRFLEFKEFIPNKSNDQTGLAHRRIT